MKDGFRIYWFCLYLVFRLCEGIVRLLPLDYAFIMGRAGGEFAYRFLRKRRLLALNNLRLAFGAEMSDAQLRALNREHFQLLGANLLAGLKSSTMTHEKIWERVTANVPNERSQTGWIALISHIGNWELFSHLGEKFQEYRFGAIYQPLSNPYIDRYLQRPRTRSGLTLFDRRRDLLKCVRFLREGGVVGVLIDQGAGHAGLWTPLFGRLASSSTLAATLSIRTGLPVVPIAINTSGRARWNMTISQPLYPQNDDADLLTAQINSLLEKQIRRSPADWLWSHNRWKPLRPHILFAREQRRVFIPPEFDRTKLDPFRILFVSPNSEAAAEATLPALRAIKAGRPDTWLGVLAPEALADYWKNQPETDLLIKWRDDDSTSSLAAKIRSAARFDVATFFNQSWKPTLAVWKAGIPLRIGRRAGFVSWFYNQHPQAPREQLDAVHLNLRFAKSIGANISDPKL